MTPKEKAIELVAMFSELEMDVWDGEWQEYDEVPLTNEVAKQCAIKVADQFIEYTVSIYLTKDEEIDFTHSQYWQQVKQEIEKLS